MFRNLERWGEILNLKVFRKENGKPTGIAFVEYTDRETALGALHMNGEFFMGYPLFIEMKNRPKDSDHNTDLTTDQTTD